MNLISDDETWGAIESLLTRELYPHLEDHDLEASCSEADDEKGSHTLEVVIEDFFTKRTSRELCMVVAALVETLEARRHREALVGRDVSLLHEACARLIERTDGATCLNDIVAVNGTSSGVSIVDELFIGGLIVDELVAMGQYETASSGRCWTIEEVIFLITTNGDHE